MPRPASETVAPAAEWPEGHALRPKRVADVSSVLRSLDLLVEGPSPHKEIARGQIERFDEPRAGHEDPARGQRPLLRVVARSPRVCPRTRPGVPRGWLPLAPRT